MWRPSMLLFLLGLSALSAQAGEIKSDEHVLFFPTTATLDSSGTAWRVPLHGWIFEAERASAWRRTVIAAIQEQFEVDPASDEGRRCANRAALFLVDNEGRKQIAVRIAGQVYELERSRGDGHFVGTLRLDRSAVDAHAEDGRLPFEAVVAEGDARRFRGEVLLPPATGVSVISDIDDTIKVSDVTDRRALLRHTFLLPFEAVGGMARAYAAWAERGATFHFVSSSPWQLYEPLATFGADQGFPRGAYYLKSFRLAGTSLLDLFASPLETKPPLIRGILERYPDHRFLLVGDSGEQDPEVYGIVARERPQQVRHVFIRRVEGGDNGAERFAAAFAGVPPTSWTVFEDPTALSPALATPGAR